MRLFRALVLFRPAAFLLSFGVFATSVQAQFGGVSPSGVNAAFIKLFGPHTTFSAQVDVRVVDKSGKDWVRLPAKVFALDQKLRMEIDMGQVVSRDLPEFAIRSLKESGMSQVVSIVRPDKKATFLIYPGAESFLNLPLSAEDAKALEKGYKIDVVRTGKETLDGKERIRNNVAVKDATGGIVLAATTWTAPDLKDFPVQIQTKQDNMTVLLKFAQVQFVKPAAAQFDMPAGYTEYQDMQKMMFGIMKKIVSNSSEADSK